jgi:hypothetical protein
VAGLLIYLGLLLFLSPIRISRDTPDPTRYLISVYSKAAAVALLVAVILLINRVFLGYGY